MVSRFFRRRRVTAGFRNLAIFSSSLLLLTLCFHAFNRPQLTHNLPVEATEEHINDLAYTIIHTRQIAPSPLTIAFSPYLSNGFGAQLLRIVNAAAIVHLARPHAHLCIHENRYWNYGCAPFRGWTCYFHARPCPSLRRCTELSTLTPDAFWHSSCIKLSTPASARIAEAIHLNFTAHRRPHSPAALSRALLTPLWNFNPATASYIRAQVSALHLRTGAYIAVHIRRGDKLRETAPLPVARYAAAVRVLARPREPIFLASDDGSVLRAMRKELPDHALLSLPDLGNRRAHIQSEHNRVWMKRRYNRVADMLAEIEVMREARVFIGTFSSNLGRLVHGLRHASEESSISLDDRWAPGVAWHTFGQAYCKSASANGRFCRAAQSPY